MKTCINKNVFYRYEKNIDNGVLVIFFKDTNKIFELTEPYYLYLDNLDKGNDNNYIENIFQKRYPDIELKEIKESILYIKNKLFDLGVLI